MATTEPNETEATERNANRQNQTERVSPNSEGIFYLNTIWLYILYAFLLFFQKLDLIKNGQQIMSNVLDNDKSKYKQMLLTIQIDQQNIVL